MERLEMLAAATRRAKELVDDCSALSPIRHKVLCSLDDDEAVDALALQILQDAADE